MNHDDAIRYCREVLPGVSRTFALGIEGLSDPLRDEVGVAYLVCRVLDTLEDTTDLPADDRAAMLDRAARDFPDPDRWRGCAAAVEAMFSAPALTGSDHALCRKAETVLSVFHGVRPEAREAMTPPVREMAIGMAATVRRELQGEGLQLETMEDLERYCYYVAGTVGHLLTGLFAVDRPSIDAAVEASLREREVRFGLGLQVTNVIKGITDDIARGVAYVPRRLLQGIGVDLATLVSSPSDPRGREVVAALVENTLPWLDSALEYTLAVPVRERDIRLFCALPLVFAVRTLGRAVATEEAFSEKALKIGRDEVESIHERVESMLNDDDGLTRLYEDEKRQVVEQIERVRA